MSLNINNSREKDNYPVEFNKVSEKNESCCNFNCPAELSLNRREFELMTNKVMEKDLIINKLNYQILKHKEEYNKLLFEKDSQKFEIKDIQENYERCLNENIENSQKLNEIREKYLHIEDENYSLKNELNKTLYKLNEISINYEKLRELYNDIKTEKQKLNENYININQENLELKRELANLNNSDLSKNFINKKEKILKNILESELLRVNSTDMSSNERLLNFNFKESERNITQASKNKHPEFIKSPEYVTDSSYNFSNNNLYERAASPYRIDDVEEILIKGLKSSKDVTSNRNPNEKVNYIISNHNNKWNEVYQNNNVINMNDVIYPNNYDKIDHSLDVNDSNENPKKENIQSSSIFLSKNFSVKNFMINVNKNDKQEIDNDDQKEKLKSDISPKKFEKTDLPEIFNYGREKNLINNEICSENIRNEKKNIIPGTESDKLKENSPSKREIIKKFSKPPSVKDMGKRCKTAKNLHEKEKNTIEIIDNQNKQKNKNKLIRNDAATNKNRNQNISNTLNLGNKSFSERCITIDRNLIHSRDNERNIFDKFKIESTVDNKSIVNNNNTSFNLNYEKSICSKNNKTSKSKDEKIENPKDKESENFRTQILDYENRDKIDSKTPYISSAVKYNNDLGIKNEKIFRREVSKENIDPDKKEKIDLNLKEIESFINMNGMSNPVGSFLKNSAENLKKVFNQAENILMDSKTKHNSPSKDKRINLPFKRFNPLGEKENVEKEKVLKETLEYKIKENINDDEYNRNLDSNIINESYNNKSNFCTENYISNNFENLNYFNKNDENNNFFEDRKRNLLVKSNLSDNTPYNSNLNIYSNMNLSALNKINEKVENLHPNSKRSPAYCIKNSQENQVEKVKFLTDVSLDKNNNLSSSNKNSSNSSKIILNNMKSNVKTKQNIEEETLLECNKKKIYSDKSLGSIFHYQNKIFPQKILDQKKSFSGNKHKTHQIQNDKFKWNVNNISIKDKNYKETHFLGITKNLISQFQNSKNAIISADDNRLAKSLKIEIKKEGVHDIEDLDFSSLVENQKIIQFSKQREKILKELSKLPEYPKSQKQIMKKRELELNLNEIDKVLYGVINIFGDEK